MVAIPDEVMKVLNDPASVRVIATKSEKGDVHIIQAGSIMAPAPDTVVIGAVLMKRTGKNLEGMKSRGEMVSILAGSKGQSYEIRAKVKELATSGPIFEGMNAELAKTGMKASGVWMFEVKEVWNQSANHYAGTKMV